MVKRFFLFVAIIASFFVGFSVPAEAWPGVADRERWHGYFKNRFDDFGDPLPPSH